MTSRPSPLPPNRRLWHPTNGIVFQQQQQQPPQLYPVLDVARFTTEASSGKEPEAETMDAPIQIPQSKAGFRTDFNGKLQEKRTTGFKASGSQTTRTTSNTYSIQERNVRSSQGARLEAKTSSMETIEAGMQELSVEEGQTVITETKSEQDSTELSQESLSKTSVSATAQIQDVPFTPLEYKMVDEAFQAAKVAKEGSAGSYWSYSLYRGPNQEDDIKGKVRVYYCKNAQDAELALQGFVGEKILGLDLEWYAQARKNAGVRKNVSLMQIASSSRIVLLHLALYPPKDDFVTPTLRKLLEDPEVSKLGVWINGDCTRIAKFLGVEVQGKFELSHLYKQVKYCASGQPEMIDKKFVRLASQIEDIMGLPMKKDQDVRTSDWSRALNQEQIGYSASDAYAAVQLFAMLNHMREKLDPCPDLPFHTEKGAPIPLPLGLKPPPNDVALAEDDVSNETELACDGEAASEANVELKPKPRKAAPAAKRSRAVKEPNAPAAAAVPVSLPPDPRLEAADAWLQEFRATRKTTVSPSYLRAYHIWHNDKDMDCATLARLRGIQVSSAANYIMTSVLREKLPYDVDRMRTVVTKVPEDVARRVFFPVWAAVNSGRV